ncbi:MAG: hypothetical protein HKN28_02180, partial [Alphaproteobacteria bacterium]|nr:hypothetical protein [Alphaproteobacteria bacterium]
FLLGRAALAEPDISAPTGARNVTEDWRIFWRDGDLDAERVDAAFATVRDELRGYRIVVVPSYLSGILIDAGEFRLADYFRTQIEALNAERIETQIAPVDTEQSVAENGRRLAAFIGVSDRPVCIVSHSKGGLDTLEFLLRAEPEVRRQIACWVVLQSPFAGSPVADLIVDEDWTRGITEPVLRALGGSGNSIDDLTVKVRTEYMNKYSQNIENITKTIPMIALATYVDGSRTPSLHVAGTYRWMRDQGVENDGLVPLNSALLPNVRYVVLPGLDHTDPVARKPIMGNPIDRVLLWKSLLYMALSDRPT